MNQNDDGIYPLASEPPGSSPAGSPPPKPIPVYLPPSTPARKTGGRSFFGALFRYVFIILFILSVILNIYLWSFLSLGVHEEEYRPGLKDQKIALIDLQGLINMSAAAEFQDMLKRAETDQSVRGVILVVNSPGGYVVPSDMMNRYLKDFQEKSKKTVYVSIQQVGASGAIWATAPAERIFAQQNAAVGSIGVMYMSFVVEELFQQKLGISPIVIKSSRAQFKDRGTPFRMPSEEEKIEIQKDLNTVHERFVKIVAEGRSDDGLSEQDVWKFANGDVFDGPEAKALKLIDEVGFLDDAIDALAEELKIKRPQVIRYRRPPSILELLTAKTSAWKQPLDIQEQLESWAMTPRIQAVWMGR